jgi:fatty acid desaturase
MPAVQAANPRQMFTAQEWAVITMRSKWRGLWLVAHCWVVVFGVIGIATYWGNPAGWLIAVILIGGRQLGLAILMHDAAHGLLHPNRRLNNFLGQWVTGAAVGTDLQAYRTYHLTHHKYTQQLEDPDLALSLPFPTSRQSMMRKVMRDLTGQVFAKQRAIQGVMAIRSLGSGAKETSFFVGKAFVRFTGMQIILLTLSLTLYGWTPFVLWFLSLATTFQLFLRIRNIAEHACTATGSDDPFTHARTTYANWIERATVAPYWVNYHSEHHLFMGVPCYHLARAHAMLGQGGYHRRMTIAPGYAAVLRQVTTTNQPA